MNKECLTIVKVGGKIVEEEVTLEHFLNNFSKLKGKKILVHGGGRSATKLADELGIESKMINGRRITDKNTLQIVTMVYGGLVNKNIVAGLQALDINALGLTGADMNIIQSDKRPVREIDYGYVGDVKYVNTEALQTLLNTNITPVLAPLTHDGKGTLLNTNADTIAAETAQALSSIYDVTLIYCFEKNGVLMDENNEDSVISLINKNNFKEYLDSGVIQGGMIPKLENAFNSIEKGVKEVLITKADNLSCDSLGTRIV